MHCPVDESPLVETSYKGYPILRCAQCLGVSISGSLLREVRAHAALNLHKGQGYTSLARPCPRDGTAMKSLVYKDIPICACPRCLCLWLDTGTLARLLEVVAPPMQEDLSRIGRSLAVAGSPSSLGDLGGLEDILDLTGGVLDAIGNLTD